MKDKDGRLVVSEKDRGKSWTEHMEKIMTVENEWDQMVEVDMVEGPVEGVTDEEVMQAMNKMKLVIGYAFYSFVYHFLAFRLFKLM